MTGGGDPLTRWVQTHPWTIGYVAAIVTLLLILQLVELLG